MFYTLLTMPSVPVIPVAPNGDTINENYFFQARAILQLVIAWMQETVILRVGGVNVTFLGLLIICVVYRIIVTVIHHFIPGILDDDDSDDDDHFVMPWGWNRP